MLNETVAMEQKGVLPTTFDRTPIRGRSLGSSGSSSHSLNRHEFRLLVAIAATCIFLWLSSTFVFKVTLKSSPPISSMKRYDRRLKQLSNAMDQLKLLAENGVTDEKVLKSEGLLQEVYTTSMHALSISSWPAEQELKALGHATHEDYHIKAVLRLNDVSATDFHATAGNAFIQTPTVLENTMQSTFNATDWTREGILRTCGHRRLQEKDESECDINAVEYDPKCEHHVKEIDQTLIGKTWAGLRYINLTEAKLTTVADFMHAQERNPNLYLHDASLFTICPKLMEQFMAPKYFPIDVASVTLNPGYKDGTIISYHPSLFIGKKGSGSPLHSDSNMTRFWLLVMAGSKRVRMMSPSDNWKAASTLDQAFQPTLYSIDLMAPDFKTYPASRDILVYETTLKAGDLLFIPAGWAHQVVNLEDVIATSQNFVDMDSVDMRVRSETEQMIRLDDDEVAYKAAMRQLDQYKDRFTAFYLPLITPSEALGHIPWKHYMAGHVLEQAPVPQAVVDFVRYRRHPELPMLDGYGRCPLHVAVRHNFVSVAKYLINKGGMDMNVLNPQGYSPLAIASLSDFDVLQHLLESMGATDIRPELVV